MCVSYGIIEGLARISRISRIIFNIHFSLPPLPLPHIAYHRPEVVAGHGEHLFTDDLLHASLKGMEGDIGITVAEALLQDIQDATYLKNAFPVRRGIDEKDADGGVQLHH